MSLCLKELQGGGEGIAGKRDSPFASLGEDVELLENRDTGESS